MAAEIAVPEEGSPHSLAEGLDIAVVVHCCKVATGAAGGKVAHLEL